MGKIIIFAPEVSLSIKGDDASEVSGQIALDECCSFLLLQTSSPKPLVCVTALVSPLSLNAHAPESICSYMLTQSVKTHVEIRLLFKTLSHDRVLFETPQDPRMTYVSPYIDFNVLYFNLFTSFIY